MTQGIQDWLIRFTDAKVNDIGLKPSDCSFPSVKKEAEATLTPDEFSELLGIWRDKTGSTS